MNIAETIAFRELQHTVAELQRAMKETAEHQAIQACELAALKAAPCATCSARRSLDAARQQRRRRRHVAQAGEMLPPIGEAFRRKSAL